MLKILTSPLLLALAVLTAGQVLVWRRWGVLARAERAALRGMAAATLLLALGGMPLAAHALAAPLEGPFRDLPPVVPGSLDALVVLTGNQERVICGVRAFRAAGASTLILSAPEYRVLAMELGLRPEEAILRPGARNTRDEARITSETPGLPRDAVLGVVTDGWHMRRTLPEFQRHFPRAVAVPCLGGPRRVRPTDLVPQAGALWTSSIMVSEYLGIAWYAITRRP